MTGGDMTGGDLTGGDMSVAGANAVGLDGRLQGLLAPHPHRVELTGPLRTLGFPNRCANCGAVTSERLPVRKVFGRNAGHQYRTRSRRYRGYRIDTVPVPYCGGCMAQDARERESAASRWRARLGGLLLGAFPALFPLGFAVFLLVKVGPESPSGQAAGFLSLLVLVFGGAGAVLIARAWWDTRRYMVPRQTGVTLAFDFSPDISDLLDHRQRRVYAMRDATFAEAFTALNRDRVWQPDPGAERAEKRVWIVCAVLIVLGALAAALLNR
jgi:hypothetical protein